LFTPFGVYGFLLPFLGEAFTMGAATG